MSNRIVAWAAAAALTVSAAAALTLGTVASAAADEAAVASIVDAPKADVGLGAAAAAAAQSPGTVGAMHYATAGVASSSAEVMRQSRGMPTAVFVNWVIPVQPGT